MEIIEEQMIVVLAVLLTTMTTVETFIPHDGLGAGTPNNAPVNPVDTHALFEKRTRQENLFPARLRHIPEISNNRPLEAIADRTLSRPENRRYLDSIGKSIAKKLLSKIWNRKTIRHTNDRDFPRPRLDPADQYKGPSLTEGEVSPHRNEKHSDYGSDPSGIAAPVNPINQLHDPLKDRLITQPGRMYVDPSVVKSSVNPSRGTNDRLHSNDMHAPPVDHNPLDYGKMSQSVSVKEPVHPVHNPSIVRDTFVPPQDPLDYSRPSPVVSALDPSDPVLDPVSLGDNLAHSVVKDPFDPLIHVDPVSPMDNLATSIDKNPLDYRRPSNVISAINSIDPFNSPAIPHVDKSPTDYVRPSDIAPSDYSRPTSVLGFPNPVKPPSDLSRFGDNFPSVAAQQDRIDPLSSRPIVGDGIAPLVDSPPLEYIRPSIHIAAIDSVDQINGPPELVDAPVMSKNVNPIDHGSVLPHDPLDPLNAFHDPVKDTQISPVNVNHNTIGRPVDAFDIYPLSEDTVRTKERENPLNYNDHPQTAMAGRADPVTDMLSPSEAVIPPINPIVPNPGNYATP